jgi:hypothetical protein
MPSWLDHVCSWSCTRKSGCAQAEMETYAFVISNSTNQLTSHLLTFCYGCTLRALHTRAFGNVNIRRTMQYCEYMKHSREPSEEMRAPGGTTLHSIDSIALWH